MTFFTNLKLAMRLGIAFGALVARARDHGVRELQRAQQASTPTLDELSERDVAALLQLVTISEDFLATDGDVARHLYVEDGDLKAQDARAEKIAAWNEEADEALAELEPQRRVRGGQGDARRVRPPRYERFRGVGRRRRSSSRARRRSTASRSATARARSTPSRSSRTLEGLDVIHDKLEDADRRAGRTRRPRRPPPPRARPSARPDRRRRWRCSLAVVARVRRHAQRDAAGRRARRAGCARSTSTTSPSSPTALTAVARGRPDRRGRAGHRADRRQVDRRARPAVADVQRDARQDAAARSRATTRCASSSAR